MEFSNNVCAGVPPGPVLLAGFHPRYLLSLFRLLTGTNLRRSVGMRKLATALDFHLLTLVVRGRTLVWAGRCGPEIHGLEILNIKLSRVQLSNIQLYRFQLLKAKLLNSKLFRFQLFNVQLFSSQLYKVQLSKAQLLKAQLFNIQLPRHLPVCVCVCVCVCACARTNRWVVCLSKKSSHIVDL